MPAQLNFYKEYPAQPLSIPFDDGNVSRLKIKIRKSVTDQERIFNDALDHYITHYFPEFYRNMEDESFSGNNTVYDELRSRLKSNLQLENPGFDTKPPGAYKIVITRLDTGRSMYQLRDDMSAADELPDFQENLEFFNEKNDIGNEIVGQTELDLSTVLTDLDSLSSLMKNFKTQKDNYNGAVPVGGVNFSFLENSVGKIISIVIAEAVKTIEVASGGSYRGKEGDKLTIYFSNRIKRDPAAAAFDPLGIFPPKIAIAGITYLAGDFASTDFLKVGYFSVIKYKKKFSDQATLKILQRYKEILEQGAAHSDAGQPYPMFDFLSNILPEQINQDMESGNFFSFPTPNERDKNENNALVKEAIRLGLIDVNNTDDLEKGIKALSTEELITLKEEVAKNPELYERVYQDEKKKRLETGIDISNVIENALEIGPLAVFEEGSAVDRILGQIGLKALAREAMICLTFGMNFELARIARAVGNVMEEELNERPSLDPLQFELFKIKGDIWKIVLDIILNSVMQAITALIKGLAELLKEACNLNNPRATDYGATDLAGMIQNDLLDPLAGQNPFGYGNDGNSALGQLTDMLGMSPDDIYQYLADVSSILSSIDICILLMDTQNAPEELIDRIIEFNLSYADPNISTKLIEASAVIEFFTILGNIVDVTDLCNEIINDLSLLNQNNICLTEDDLAQLDAEEMQNIEDLLDIIENGFTDAPPVFNFDCPDADNYVNDPTMTKLIPETLSTMIELVEMQFVYSVDSIKSVLLEPSLARASGTGKGEGPYDTFKTMVGSDYPELPEPDSPAINAIMNSLKSLAEEFENPMDHPLAGAIQECLINQPGLLNSEIRNFADAIEILLNIFNNDEIRDAIDNMVEKADELSQGSGPAVTTYKFNKEFYRKFADYIKIETADFISIDTNRKQYRIKNHFKRYTTSDDPVRSRIQFSFPRFNATKRQRIVMRYPAYGAPEETHRAYFNLDGLFESNVEEQFRTDMEINADSDGVAYNLDQFVDAARSGAEIYDNLTISENAAVQRYFPFAYGLLTDQVFDYYIENGVFNAGALQSLTFFHDNINCSNEDISDLLDVEGIFKQMQREYVEEACNNNPADARRRMREVIKYGMFLLLVQVHVAEFVIKNIFVLSAVQMDELFAKPFIVSYMRDQVNASMTAYFESLTATGNAETVEKVKDSLIVIFNRMMLRPNVIAEGGVTDLHGDVVFPNGTVFLMSGKPRILAKGTPTATFDDILDYLAVYRIQSAMGTADSPGPTSNAVKNALPVSNQKPMEEIFLNSMPVMSANRDRQSSDPGRPFLSGLSHSDEPWQSKARRAIAKHLNNKATIFVTKSKPEAPPPVPGYSSSDTVGRDNKIVYEFWMYVDNLSSFDLKPVMTPGSFSTGNPSELGDIPPPAQSDVNNAEYVFKLFETAPLDFGQELEDRLKIRIENEPSKTLLYSTVPPTAEDHPTTYHERYREEIRQSLLTRYDMKDIVGFRQGSLNPEEVQHILNDENYKEYFTNVFSQEIIGILPIIHNFYLTNNYFGDIRQAMRSTKNRVLDILNTTIDNHDSYNSNPDLARSGARTVSLSNNEPDADNLARDFIIKMLIKTPIDIIKGLMQMIDPHVIISKFIKNGTADVFNLIQGQLRSIDLPSPEDDPTPAIAPFATGATGADLFTAVLCLLQYLMENPEGFPARPDFINNETGLPPGDFIEDPPPENFFPRISEDGVDFLGTGMGMLMIPPTPLGLIYLLLSLINFDTQQPNLDVGVEFGDDLATAGDEAIGSCPDDLIVAPDEGEELEESLDAVRPPYVEN